MWRVLNKICRSELEQTLTGIYEYEAAGYIPQKSFNISHQPQYNHFNPENITLVTLPLCFRCIEDRQTRFS